LPKQSAALALTSDDDDDFRSGSFTSFRAREADFRFALDFGRFSASQRTVETGHNRTCSANLVCEFHAAGRQRFAEPCITAASWPHTQAIALVDQSVLPLAISASRSR